VSIEKVDPFKFVKTTNRLMRGNGLFLVTQGRDRKPNAMTIGWGLLGTVWRRPFFVVAVRHSRYTFKLMEESGVYAVCLPSKGMRKVLDVCGTKSGRDVDKFKELKLTTRKGLDVDAPYIEECPVHYECVVRYKNDLKPGLLAKEIEDDVYSTKDMHMIYYGEVMGAYAVKDAARKLPR